MRDGRMNPSYRCLFPEPPPPGAVPACAEAGILGALTGVMGSLMALEVDSRNRRLRRRAWSAGLLMIDTRTMRFETLNYGWDPTNPLSGEADDPGSRRRWRISRVGIGRSRHLVHTAT